MRDRRDFQAPHGHQQQHREWNGSGQGNGRGRREEDFSREPMIPRHVSEREKERILKEWRARRMKYLMDRQALRESIPWVNVWEASPSPPREKEEKKDIGRKRKRSESRSDSENEESDREKGSGRDRERKRSSHSRGRSDRRSDRRRRRSDSRSDSDSDSRSRSSSTSRGSGRRHSSGRSSRRKRGRKGRSKRGRRRRRRHSDSEDEYSRSRSPSSSRSRSPKRKRKRKRRKRGKEEELQWTEKEVLPPSVVVEQSLEEVGPKPLPDVEVGSYGGQLLKGEGEAMAKFVQQNKRIPRRGEVGLSAEQIESFEDMGYVMSGSRHKVMNAVRIRKENQVYSAEEKRAFMLLRMEEKAKRENQILADFREMLAEKELLANDQAP